ncbi:hypothetical protein AX774_g4187 [Zancudomyces culisetae]|uniref:Integrase catalytic domain-containing protein n=1 Tax=Zancudomyces culisetae TaxID=1213189 RepID=A0A1R1PMZ6_ZANCU|nr:hypothetical protein AX774_g4187 [Zancudomyces culisetae]|eukprot:OMH82335.1 hypothetical protein AX774_g4187 [Zancudomyces culisetae]
MAGSVAYFGVPQQIISDRGSSFVSNITTSVFEWLGVNHTPTTSYRPQSDGVLKRLEIDKPKFESHWEGPYEVERVLT